MALVVQLVNRAGAVISTQVFDRERISIGRALDCDLVLQDPHVEPRHLEISVDGPSGRLASRDLGSLNGSWRIEQNPRGAWSKKKIRVRGSAPFFSGQIFEVGKSHLRICSSDHAVPPALPLSRWEALGHSLAHWWVYGLLALLLIGLQIWDSYLSEPSREKLSQFALNAIYPVLAAVVYAGVWGFIGKNIRHDGKFTSHLAAALAAILAVSAFEFSAPYWAFQGHLWRWQGNFVAVFSAAIVFLLGFLTLSFATHLRGFAKTAVALVAPTVLLIPMLLEILGEPEFSSAPPYNRSLVEPAWQFQESSTAEDFLRDAEKLFSQPDQSNFSNQTQGEQQ